MMVNITKYKIKHITILTAGLFFFCTNSLVAQDLNFVPKHQLFGSLHLSNYIEDDEFSNYNPTLGVGFEYRKYIKSFSERLHLGLGLNLESVAVKRVYENDDFFLDKQFNLTVPFGIYYTSPNSYYIGLFTSFDIPFANGNKSKFGDDEWKHIELSPRFLNLNFSGGINAGKVIAIGDKHLIIELHFKALALLGFRENDYWHYPEGAYPYYYGIKTGIGF